MIDSNGFRLNVGIILANHADQVFWAKRLERDAWQFPQGGMHKNESPEETLFRELREEIGLEAEDVTILGRTRHWLRYRSPKRPARMNSREICIGQKQLWFLLRLNSEDNKIHLDASPKPEFDAWEWVSFWYPLWEVVAFKREVYRRAMLELVPYLFTQASRPREGRRPLHPLL